MPADLTDRVLIVTGASSGIGAATAQAAAQAGMRVALAARRAERLEQVAERIRQTGGQALAVPTDVTDGQQVQNLIDQTVDHFGRLDALFANAGFGVLHPLAEPDGGIEQRVWDVNYFGTLRCIRAAVPAMQKQGGGHLIICSSIVGRTGLPYYGTYAATKAAQHALAASLALELEPDRIHVSAVYPIGTRTEFFRVAAHENGRDALEENTPEIAQQSPQQVARSIVRCLRRPTSEVWPSRIGRRAMLLWTRFPRFYRFCFRFHARKCRKVIRNKPR